MIASKSTRYATILAAIMHLAGAVGVMIGLSPLFSKLTPFNLLTMFGLLIWTAPQKSKAFFFFISIAFLTGLITEIIGVNTSILFGQYHYGESFGPKLLGVPFLIGLNWFVVVYASGMIATQIRQWIGSLSGRNKKLAYSKWLGFSAAFDGALIATAFDFLMEPAAVNLGFWIWHSKDIPLLNYLSWFGISFLLLLVFNHLKFKYHSFAVYLLIIQAIFFQLVLNLSAR